MTSAQYPLEQLTLIKKKKLEEAEKILQEKKEFLLKEEVKLKQVEKERDKVKEHKIDKLTQLRAELDTGTTSGKIQQMKNYLKEVDEKFKQKESKVKEQKKQVDSATQSVETARQDMLKKQQSVEKMRLHKEEWRKEQKMHEEHLEALENDEMGTTIFSRKRLQNKPSTSSSTRGTLDD